MKVHRHLILSYFKALRDIFQSGFYADRVIERNFKLNKKWGARDRRFFAETIYESVRWWRLVWVQLDQESSFEDADLWKFIGMLWKIQGHELPDSPEFQFLKEKKLLARETLPRAVQESIPDWLDQIGYEDLSDRWEPNLRKLNQQASVILRTNTNRIERNDLKNNLQKEQILTETLDNSQIAMKLVERQNVFNTESFKRGEFEVQDFSSQQVSEFLQVEPGMRVIDACAGAGGKSLHLAALMKNKGKIIALDIHEKKLEELMKRARRARADIIETRLIENSKVIKRLEETGNRLLLDVPCSGTGVLNRNPDSKWKLTLAQLLNLIETQREILKSYSRMVKVGEKMVYSTCSLLSRENQNQIRWLLNTQPGSWDLEEEKTLLPAECGYDGFYIARLKRLR